MIRFKEDKFDKTMIGTKNYATKFSIFYKTRTTINIVNL